MKYMLQRRDDGFSLVELIASLTLAGILAVALMTIVITALNGFFLSRNAAQVSQKAQVALARLRAELIKASAITTANANKIVFTNEYGTYEIERINNTISLTKTGSGPIPSKILIDSIQTDYGTDSFLVFEKTGSIAWSTSDDISELYAITILLKFNDYSGVFRTTINPRMNTLRNAPKMALLEPFAKILTGNIG